MRYSQDQMYEIRRNIGDIADCYVEFGTDNYIVFKMLLHCFNGLINRGYYDEYNYSTAVHNLEIYTKSINKGDYYPLVLNYVAVWNQWSGFRVFATREVNDFGLLPVTCMDLDMKYQGKTFRKILVDHVKPKGVGSKGQREWLKKQQEVLDEQSKSGSV